MQKAKAVLVCGLGILIVLLAAVGFSMPLQGPYAPQDCTAVEALFY